LSDCARDIRVISLKDRPDDVFSFFAIEVISKNGFRFRAKERGINAKIKAGAIFEPE